MGPPEPNAAFDQWVHDALGVNPAAYQTAPPRAPQPGQSPGGAAVGVGAPVKPAFDVAACRRGVGPALTKDGPNKPGARLSCPLPTAPPVTCRSPEGREVQIARTSDGRVSMTHPAPPIQEITFSGGGGKGNALPGAIWALSKTDVLKGAKEIHGASVGSITASLVACGMTPQEFQDLSDNTDFKSAINGDDIGLIHHEAKGLETILANALKSTLGKRIAEFIQTAQQGGEMLDPQSLATLNALTAKFAGGQGPNFGDLRTLSKMIPDIKEAVVTGTMIGVSKTGKPDDVTDARPELKVLSADTEPQLEVAVAVHASMALPPVFKPVDITLHDGTLARFEDGGVLNNTPSSDTLGQRAVDPVPDTGKMTFVFDSEDADNVLQGKAKPDRSAFEDWIAGGEVSAANYSQNKTLSENPDDVVKVPLQFTTASGKKVDKRGLLDGTMAFNMPKEDRIRLQNMTEAATLAHIQKATQPETRSFASDAQMLNCSPRADVEAMAASNYPGAADTLAFRDTVAKLVAQLEAEAAAGTTGQDPKVKALLTSADAAAQGEQERLAYVGRELNRSGKLDALLGGARDPQGKDSTGVASLDAGLAVNEVVQVRAVAKTILDQALYPKLVRTKGEGVEGGMLTGVEKALRDATTRAEINRALTVAIDYYNDKFDLFGLLGNGDFAKELRTYLQPTH